MPIPTCCAHASPRPRANLKTRRAMTTAKWLLPTAVLALLPKCPMCLAAYIALATGVGVSMSTATCIRFGLLITSFSALTYFTATAVRRRL